MSTTATAPETPATEEAPAATEQVEPSPLESFMASKREEVSGTTEEKPTEEKPSEDSASVSQTDTPEEDPLSQFLGDKPEEKPTEEEPTEESVEDIDPATLKSAENWAKAKEKIQTKVAADYETRLTELQNQVKERDDQIAEMDAKVSRFSLAESSAFKETYSKPKQQAVSTIERLGGDSPEVKQMAQAMRAGTLGIADVPNLDDLGEFQKRSIYENVQQWLQTNEAEKAALENHSATQKEMEIREMEMEQQRSEQYSTQLSQRLHHSVSKATAEAVNLLPGYSEDHAQKVQSMLSEGDPVENIGRALTLMAWAPDTLQNMRKERDTAVTQVTELETQVEALKKRLGSADDLDKASVGGPSAPAQSDQSPLSTLMSRIVSEQTG